MLVKMNQTSKRYTYGTIIICEATHMYILTADTYMRELLDPSLRMNCPTLKRESHSNIFIL